MEKRTAKLFSIIVLLVVVTVFRSSAQKLPFKNYSTKDGLVHNDVCSIYQDSQGYLWIGTAEGISRFDGATFTNYMLKDDSSSAMPTAYVNTFFEDRKSNLWIGLNLDGGVSKFNLLDRSFVKYKIIPDRPSQSNYVNTILQDAKGTFWFGTNDGFFTFENGFFRRFRIDTLKTTGATMVLYEDRHGTVWIATHQGLYRHGTKSGTQLVQLPGLRTILFNALYEDKEGNLWIGTDDIGLIKLKNHPPQNKSVFPLKTYTIADGLPSNSVHDILQDESGTLWIATWEGLSKLLPGTQEFITYTTANGLPSNNVVDLLQDREGNLWFATTKGISKLTGETFVNYGESEGLPGEFLLQVTLDANDDLWFVGTNGACRLTEGTFVPVEALRGQHVLSVAVDDMDIVWFGTTNGIVKCANGSVLARYTTTNRLPDKAIHSIFHDSRGRIWFGFRAGVSQLWEGKFRNLYGDANSPLEPGMNEDHAKYPLVIGMTEDEEGTVWFATYRHGVYKFPATYDSDSNWVKVDIPISFRTRAILCDRNNKLWIGTRLDGVFRYDPQTGALRQYTTADGLSSNFVRSIFQDSKGNFWFGTTRGVNRFDGTSFRQYSTRDGLAGDAVFACVEDEQDNLWFATSTGVSRYNPAYDQRNTIPPPTYLTRFRVFGKEIPIENGIHLSASQHSVSFEYVGISFKDETQVRYQYRLKGLDPDWSEVTERRYVNYTNLSPGSYTFEVRARNMDGVWSVQPATFKFSIATPIWQRWWFITLMVLAAGGVAFGIHRYRLNKLLEMERMRTGIATDLHDEIGTTLSSIALFSEMARSEIQNIVPEVAHKLKDVSNTAQQLVETMRDIVWSINPVNDTVEDVVLYMKQFAAEVLEAKGIEFTFKAPEQMRTLRLPMDVRHHLYLIFKEAINNLVRHSGCSHADIHLNLADGMLTFAVSDNGKGFNKSEPFSGSGLKNMRKRAQAINGTFTIDTAPGKGTIITLRMLM
jgi:ligand-binding sensor domain-containing protein/signal transduction histidine kinase